MRRILLPIALACAVCGVVTASTFVHTADTGAVQQQYLGEPTPVQTPEMAVGDVPSTTPSASATTTTTTMTSSTSASHATTLASSSSQANKQQTSAQAAADRADPGQQLPLSYSGSAGQVITVVAPSRSSTTATLTAWVREGTGWRSAIGPVTANVGSSGIGEASETVTRTPAGVFGLTEAFGVLANNGTKLPYFKVDDSDWWVSDAASPAYNTHVRCIPGTCPFNEKSGEHLLAAGGVYNHAVVINYNRGSITPGAGSAFFLHVSNGRPTAGCVSVPSDQLDAIMRWLDPGLHPVINIG